MSYGNVEDAAVEPLIKVNVDRQRLGDNYAQALVQLIEEHEFRYSYTSTRKTSHILMRRYAELCFPDVELTYGLIRSVLRTLNARYFHRFNRRFTARMSSERILGK